MQRPDRTSSQAGHQGRAVAQVIAAQLVAHYEAEGIELVVSEAMLVSPEEELHIVEQHASDNRYLECAVAGHAAYVVSADDHLLAVGEYRGIRLLPPRKFLVLLKLEDR